MGECDRQTVERARFNSLGCLTEIHNGAYSKAENPIR